MTITQIKTFLWIDMGRVGYQGTSVIVHIEVSFNVTIG